MKKTDIAWIAGILEGEGSFSLNQRRYASVVLRMSDRDIVERVAGFFGVRVCGPYKTRAHYKPTYLCQVSGQTAIEWMKRIFDFMGERRKAQMSKAFEVYESHQRRDPKKIQRAKRGSRTPARCHPDRPVTGMGLCKPCYLKAYYPERHNRKKIA